ncbi:MAG: hypothetical protein ACREOU_13035 [Candidatus Eiseniibacteriota bacterium]
MSGRPDAPVQLILLWHQHQPGYGSPRAGRPVLPWVRLHATKDYLDMADRLLARPGLAVTTNLVPSLLEQLAAAAAGVDDPELDLVHLDPEVAPGAPGVAGAPGAGVDPDTRRLLLARLGIVPVWARARFPALGRLFDRRAAADPVPLTNAEIVDLQTLHTLAWIDPLYYARASLADLVARAEKGGGFAREERDRVLAEATVLMREVLPRYRELASHPRCEISVTPYYHPILPLVVDVASARRALPQIALPQEAFAHPEDARAHLVAARRTAERALGFVPRGLWPSEGSVSPEVVSLAGESGYRWTASDEEVLKRSLAAGEGGDWPHARPWRLRAGGPGGGSGGGPWLFFRDHELSDKIGFVYARWNATDAVSDFVARLAKLRNAWRGPGPAHLLVALDGENCWETYPNDGHEFLERLYDALESTDWIGTTTPGAVVDRLDEAASAVAPSTAPVSAGELAALHSGSWISANFRIWIGHAEKNRAWNALARARRALVSAFPDAGGGPPPEAFWNGNETVWGEDLRGTPPADAPLSRDEAQRQAWRHLLIAEGSDWCWWLGEDHFTEDKAIFDRTLREHLMRVYELAGTETPAELLAPFGTTRVREERTAPRAVLMPSINGRHSSYYEWNGAGRWRPAGAGGAMHAGRLIRELDFGFDERNLYVRVQVDPAWPVDGKTSLSVEFLEPAGPRLVVERGGSGYRFESPGSSPRIGSTDGGPADPSGAGVTALGVRAAWESVCEAAIPFAYLGVTQGRAVRWVVVLRTGSHVIETAPEGEPLAIEVPGPDLEARFWSA